jgi:hypothetical protein
MPLECLAGENGKRAALISTACTSEKAVRSLRAVGRTATIACVSSPVQSARTSSASAHVLHLPTLCNGGKFALCNGGKFALCNGGKFALCNGGKFALCNGGKFALCNGGKSCAQRCL